MTRVLDEATITGTCFPEPSVEDPSVGRDGEPTPVFLARSTWDRAREMREFYNQNLAKLPPEAQAILCREIRRDATLAKHFELVVGRFLQELGADPLEYEVPGSEGRRVDWQAHFPDGSVSVEATAPIANAIVGNTLAGNRRATAAVVAAAPPGWWVIAGQVPRIGQSESLRWFRRELEDVFRDVPAPTPEGRWSVERTYDQGRLEVDLFAQPNPAAPARSGGGQAVGYVDDSSVVVARAIDGKRDQVRGAVKPVLAAITTFGWGDREAEKFDVALLGHTTSVYGTDHVYFNPDGVFRPGPGHREPTFAGALVFADLGWRGGRDPILYVHPRYRGTFPTAIAGLRRRYATDSDVVESPAAREGIIASLGWPTA